jgi:hypothetical protein
MYLTKLTTLIWPFIVSVSIFIGFVLLRTTRYRKKMPRCQVQLYILKEINKKVKFAMGTVFSSAWSCAPFVWKGKLRR